MNQPLDLNLSSRPFRNNTWVWAGLLLGISLVGLASWWNYSIWNDESEQLAALRKDVQGIDSKMADLGRREVVARKGVRSHDLELLASQALKANDVIMLKAFSWTRLFNRLEKIQPYDVRMKAIRPVFRLGKKHLQGRKEAVAGRLESQSVLVTVEGSAKSLKAFLELETALMEDPWFDRVEPERYSRSKNGETQFSLRFHYYPNKKPEPEGAKEAGEVEQAAEQGTSIDGKGNG